MKKKREAPTVLIIEDEVDIRNFASRVLELEGYRVLKAANGETGMEIIKKHPVSLVLLDLRLPGCDGWSILREIKRDPTLSAIPVVVLTAMAETVQRRRTLRMGATRYLIKPLSAHILSKTVTDILYQSGGSYFAQKSVGVRD